MVNPILLIIIPLGLAFLVPVFRFVSKKIEKYIPFVALLSNLIVSIQLLPLVLEKPVHVSIGGFLPPLGINLVAGPLGIMFAILIALVGLLVSIYAFDYIKEENQEKYHVLYLLLLTAATGVVLTGDIFNLFVFYEILCISSYSLVAYFGDKAGTESAVKYLIQGAVGSSLVLIGIGLL
jgi:formate hydrogenlyase subunit 3/multisubunit Na+/H+ antiporter MnhD subunit